MHKTIFVHKSSSTFVLKDLKFLEKYSKVIQLEVGEAKGILSLLVNIIVAFKMLLNIRKVDLIYIWFVDYHALFPILIGRIMGIKTVVIVGGFDAVAIPSFNFGLFNASKLRQWIGRICYRNVDLILPVDKSLVAGTNIYADPEGIGYPTGVLSFVPDIRAKIEVVPTGYDKSYWMAKDGIAREKAVVSVGNINNETVWKRKGGDLLNEVAHAMPEIPFYFYGISDEFKDYLESSYIIAPNFYLMGKVRNEELPDIYASCQIYAQFSLSEGLPNVLCEAMLCGCIPVGSSANGIPDVIDDVGVVINRKDVNLAKDAIIKAFSYNKEISSKARERITKCYPNSRREGLLAKLLFGQKI